MSQVNLKEVDPKMLENLDLLLNMDIAESEEDWDSIEGMESAKENEMDEEDFDET